MRGGSTVKAAEVPVVVMGVQTETKTLELLDLKSTLSPEQAYMDGMVTIGKSADASKSGDLTFTEANNTATDENGVEHQYTGVLGGGAGSAKPLEGTGRYICITPKYDGTVTVAVKLQANKPFVVDSVENNAISSTDMLYSIADGGAAEKRVLTKSVKAGVSYYFYSKGGGTDWYSFAYTYEQEVGTNPDNPGDVEMETRT